MPIAPPALITGAARQSLPYGIFSAFPMRPADSDRWEAGVQFETDTCDPVQGLGGWDCDPPEGWDEQEDGEWKGALGLPKKLDSNNGEFGEATPFTVYGHFSCSPVGYDPATAQAKAERHLLAGEEARVEQAFWTGDLGNSPSLQSADTESLTENAVDGVTGIALLEQFISEHYRSQGIIHMRRDLALYLAVEGPLVISNGSITTRLGTRVVAGAGYPGTGPAGEAVAGEAQWAYVTPAIFGYRTGILPSSNRPGDLLDRGTNTLTAIAERTYLLGFDPCGVGAALIDPTI